MCCNITNKQQQETTTKNTKNNNNKKQNKNKNKNKRQAQHNVCFTKHCTYYTNGVVKTRHY